MVVILDAVRWDVWECLRDGWLPRSRAPLSLLGEEVVWTRQPTSTRVNVDAVFSFLPSASRYRLPTGGSPDPEAREAISSGEPSVVLKLDCVDELVHARSFDLLLLCRQACDEVALCLDPYLACARPSTLVVLLADHGFRAASGSFSHGGASPPECLVPAAWLLRP